MFKLSVASVALLSLLRMGGVSAACVCKCNELSSDEEINGFSARYLCETFNDTDEAKDACNDDYCKAECSDDFGVGYESCNDCIGADTKVFSCDHQKFIPARSVVPGDKLRTLSSEDGSEVCSEVYYTFLHEGTSSALEVKLDDSSTVTVSDNHLVYVGSSFESREAARTKTVKAGDKLVSSDGSAKEVVSVESTISEFMNILTMEGSLELDNGVVISTHSFHETLYSVAFYPVKLMYQWIGAPAVKKAEPYLLEVESMMKPYFAALVDSL